jgi:hypothetical protein
MLSYNLQNTQKIYLGSLDVSKLLQGSNEIFSSLQGDPYINNVSLLLHMDGADGSQTFTDSSTNNFQVTNFDQVQILTNFKKFGTGSARFDGNVDYLNVNYNDKLNLFNTDYTIEFWLRFDIISGSPIFLTTSIANLDFDWQLRLENNALKLKSFLGEVSANWTPVINQWYHIAAVRNGSSTSLYIDGQLLVSSNLNPIDNNTNSLKIGGRGDGASLNGNIDELRITKGIARYTSNFIPQTAPFPNQ